MQLIQEHALRLAKVVTAETDVQASLVPPLR